MEASPIDLVVGEQQGNQVSLRPLYRENPSAQDYDDGNWLVTESLLEAGAFGGKVRASLCTQDFFSFRTQLRGLTTTPRGAARFETMEEWLELEVVGDGKGHFAGTGELTDSPGTGNRLRFSFAFDQTHLPAMLRQLEEICRRFPVIGEPAV